MKRKFGLREDIQLKMEEEAIHRKAMEGRHRRLAKIRGFGREVEGVITLDPSEIKEGELEKGGRPSYCLFHRRMKKGKLRKLFEFEQKEAKRL